uniref:Prepronicomicin-1 n=1 Tax=Nicomache minor TaxID=1441599 RepID=A0A3G2WH77_9ANNE|nr:prepronicomicin-1 [Nicomache minor]
MARLYLYLLGAVCAVLLTPSLGLPLESGDIQKRADLHQLLARLDRLLQEPDQILADNVKDAADAQQQHFEVFDAVNNADEAFDLDLENDKEIVTVTSGDAAGSTLVIDGAKGIISWANRLADECYLIGGVDDSLPSAGELREELQQGDSESLSLKQIVYQKVRSRVGRDTSILADEIQGLCQDKPVFWLEKVTELDNAVGGSLEKKGFWSSVWDGAKNVGTAIIKNAKVCVYAVCVSHK